MTLAVNIYTHRVTCRCRPGLVTAAASVTVTNYLFNINDDPDEYNNLATQYPDVVAELAGKIHYRRNLYPVAGTRQESVPPPGWCAPKNWASYPRALDNTQPRVARHKSRR